MIIMKTYISMYTTYEEGEEEDHRICFYLNIIRKPNVIRRKCTVIIVPVKISHVLLDRGHKIIDILS